MKVSEKNLNSWYKQAVAIAEQSPDSQTKVGSLLIQKNTKSVISQGFNGFIRGGPDNCLPKTRPEKYEFMIHSEANLIYNCVLNGITTKDCIVFCTLSPCSNCIRSLVQCGIRTVYFKDKYRDFDNCLAMKDIAITEKKTGEFYKITMEARKNGY